MNKGYWIARVDVRDPEAYKRYVAANAPSLAAYQEVIRLRLPVSTCDLVIIEGYEGPQPG
jgi:uncharacterized protein (DUF1330 family)